MNIYIHEYIYTYMHTYIHTHDKSNGNGLFLHVVMEPEALARKEFALCKFATVLRVINVKPSVHRTMMGTNVEALLVDVVGLCIRLAYLYVSVSVSVSVVVSVSVSVSVSVYVFVSVSISTSASVSVSVSVPVSVSVSVSATDRLFAYA